jgi:hypothetical protein
MTYLGVSVWETLVDYRGKESWDGVFKAKELRR